MNRRNNQLVKVGMILAQDVTKDGKLLCSKNTVLTQEKIDSLRNMGVETVKIRNSESVELSYYESVKPLPVIERKEFKGFEKEYNNKINVVKGQLIDIGSGAAASIDELYMLAEDIMGKLQRRNDIFNYIRFMKQSDEATYGHCINVSLLCNLFGHWINMKADEIVLLTVAGILHDIGKTKIPEWILCKKGKLTEAEFAVMKTHTSLGYDLLKNMDIHEDIKLSTLMHHEKIDGSGYPVGISGSAINPIASIVSICDIYDAMTANRCYRGKLSPFYVIKTFETQSYGELNTEYLLAFLQNIAYTFLNSTVKLNDGRECEVVFINKQHLSRPIVKHGNDLIDLTIHKDLDILEVI